MSDSSNFDNRINDDPLPTPKSGKTPRGAVGDIDNAVLPPPAPETRETILSTEDFACKGISIRFTKSKDDRLKWLKELQASHEALRAALATERAARITVDQQMATFGIIELAVRNPNVDSYMRHWEQRAEKAEASLAALRLELQASEHNRVKGNAELIGQRDALRNIVEQFMRATLMPTPTKPIIVARQEASKVLAAGSQGDR